ncbi:hypothetical protein BO94DRAFT_534321 [Aspergillus sclerotioniger CBS 115572]|uniref:Uncharacterized protein n=1 Tax=Aspergillus sclerotioniger CBS 115572 TaxID=1450535 RepID=A0A317WT90_9EURO|nr:hypothetical protein BO94DRAFT_534321 [Aspergillus sclerotioniger CBS 115572]PWY89549.1 hypothetical protein BO94DRAFT_534321 [Aspergillus sclerotioniger CBS 115572]
MRACFRFFSSPFGSFLFLLFVDSFGFLNRMHHLYCGSWRHWQVVGRKQLQPLYFQG